MTARSRLLLAMLACCLAVGLPVSGIAWPGNGAAYAAGTSAISFDLISRGQTMENKFPVLTVWNLNDDWTKRADGQPVDYFRTNYPFVKRVQLMTATGGCYAGYPGCPGTRDLFVDPADRKNLADYDFTTLLTAAGHIAAQGLKPYIVTGNVPVKYSSHPHIGFFGVNVSPPDDYDVYYNYIKAMADALVARFGIDEVRTWSWGVLTEYENGDWFQAADGTALSTETAYFKLYDYTEAALEAALGTGHVYVGAHSMSSIDGLWDERDFIDHVATGTNYKTGETGTHIDFLSISYYDKKPGELASLSLEDELHLVRQRAVDKGLTHLKFGVDEGRILNGPDNKQINPATVATGYQSSSDARLFKRMHDIGLDYFANWYVNTETVWGGIDPVGIHLANLSYKMAGEQRLASSLSGAADNPLDEVDGIGSFNPATGTAHLLVYNHNDHEAATSSEPVAITLDNAAPAHGSTVTVKMWVIDDNHANYWSEWYSDMRSHGITSDDFGSMSMYSWTVGSMIRQSDRNVWYSGLDKYKALAALTSTTTTASVTNGKVVFSPTLAHHGVVFYEITNVRQAGKASESAAAYGGWRLYALLIAAAAILAIAVLRLLTGKGGGRRKNTA